jgi:nitrogen fixation protein NifU and related proteins
MDVYRDTILDHYRYPRNFGSLPDPTVWAEEENSSCGDKIRIELRITKSQKKQCISDIRFSGEGCAISQASSSLLTEFVKSKTIEDIKHINGDTILHLLQITLTPTRMKCALLPLEVLYKAIGKLNNK